MASISSSSDGRRTIQFVDVHRKRRSIRLGKVPIKTAEEIRRRVEYLVVALASGTAPDADTANWLGTIGPDLHARLAAVGLVRPREKPAAERIAPFVDGYIARRSDVKPNTLLNYKGARQRVLAYFGAEKPLADVTPADADDFLRHLRAKYAAGTVARTFRMAQQFFRAALRARLISENPFDGVKTPSQVNPAKQFFVTRQMAKNVLEACPDHQWQLVFTLSRYGGLRCPSERLALTWPDVDWERGRFRVTSSETEHHEGKGERWVPIFRELRPYLEEAFERAEPGALRVITARSDAQQNLRTQFMRIIRRAGLTPWPKLFHNLRASRGTELAESFPMHVVCQWIGNSQLVAAKHYLQVTDEHYRRAAESGAAALQNPVQQEAALSGSDSHAKSELLGVAAPNETLRSDASIYKTTGCAYRESNWIRSM
jgi:integrase